MKTPRSLGRYEVVDVIGQGGMGALFRARDPRIGRYVAVKLLRAEFDTPEIRDRFSREARAAGGLSHPNIVTIYDVGEHEGLPFIAMEYVRGETFSDLVCLRPPLTVMRKLQLMEEVCAGLAHAHEAGIVHRDIKPANLIVGPEGTVKILDFGIAKVIATGMTMPGSIMGTLNYMSPEQVMGTPVDTRADIFSVGAVLYELLSHQPAFPGQTPDEVFPEILNGVPRPITEYIPDIEPRLVLAVERALEKNPDDRFQDIAALRKELNSIRQGTESEVISRQPSTRTTGGATRQGTRDRTRPAAAPIDEPPAPSRPEVAKTRQKESRSRPPEVRTTIDPPRAKFEDGDPTAFIDIKEAHVLDAEHAAAQAREAAAQDAREAAAQAAREAAAQAAREAAAQAAREAAAQAVREAAQAAREAAAQAAREAAAQAAREEREAEARLRAAVDAARRRFVNGEHQEALQSLEALQPAANPVVAKMLEELRGALREIEEQRRVEQERAERQRRISALLAEARAALKDNRFDAAAQALEQVREVDATVPELSDLTERLRRAQAAARLEEDLQRALGDFEVPFAQGDLPRAADLLKTAASLAPTDSRILSARQRLQQAAAALAAKEAAEARRREGEQKIEDAAARLEKGDLAGAADLLKLAGELVPQHPRAAGLATQLREALERQAAAEAAERLRRRIEELIRSASQRLQSAGTGGGDLVLALREVIQAIALDPENTDARSLKTAIEESIAARREAARVEATINNARRRFANGKHQAALQALEEFQPPSHPAIAAALSELRGAFHAIEEQRRAERERAERQQRVAALLAEARAALGEQHFEAALELLSQASEVDAAAPELASLTERVHQEQAAARRRADLEQALAELNESLTRGELSAASDRLSAAIALDPADSRVRLARQRVEQATAARVAAEARKRELEEKTTAAEASFARGDLQGAMRLLTLVAAIDPQHPRAALLSERVADAVRKQEAADAAERLRRTVDELLAAAAQLLRAPKPNTPDAMLAKQKIAQALSLAPDHAGALTLQGEAEDLLVDLREAARIAAAIRNARSRFAIGKHQAALQLLESLDASNPGVVEALEELRGALRAASNDDDTAPDQTLGAARTPVPIQRVETSVRPKRWSAISRLWKK